MRASEVAGSPSTRHDDSNTHEKRWHNGLMGQGRQGPHRKKGVSVTVRAQKPKCRTQSQGRRMKEYRLHDRAGQTNWTVDRAVRQAGGQAGRQETRKQNKNAIR